MDNAHIAKRDACEELGFNVKCLGFKVKNVSKCVSNTIKTKYCNILW